MPGDDLLSLLVPSATPARTAPAIPLSEADLGLVPIIHALDIDGQHSRFIAQVLAGLATDPRTIRYRQDILSDLLQHPKLVEQLAALLPRLRSLSEPLPFQRLSDESPLLQIGGRLAELDNYVTCVEGLWQALDSHIGRLHSKGLAALHAYLAAVRAEADYLRLSADLPELRVRLEQAGSITIGINLNTQLQPESATIVAISPERFSGPRTLLGRLLGDRAAAEALRGITSLYRADSAQPRTPEHDLFRDLNRLLEKVAAPVAAVVEQYKRVHVRPLAAIEPELAFYIGGARLVRELRALGLSLCQPEIAPPEERACLIKGSYSLDLALRLRAARGTEALQGIVTNDVPFDRHIRVVLLTGPNSGGKTTFTRAVGQSQVLFQAGLPIPGQQARISPADAVLSHFASAERLDLSGGRLAEELERLAGIFRVATPSSLILLNEPLTSTDQGSARGLARDLLDGLRLLGARTLFVTHIHELVNDALAQPPGPKGGVISLVAGTSAPAANPSERQPSYRIEVGSPQLHQQASAIARSYGLGRDQIAQTLRERGIGRSEPDSQDR
ncbi:MAG: DNA mismatch repair protein MutS [Roseiflexaceae bacterium]